MSFTVEFMKSPIGLGLGLSFSNQITSIKSDSQAARNGELQIGDRIIAVCGEPTKPQSGSRCADLIGPIAPGQTVTLEVKRTDGEQEAVAAATIAAAARGMIVRFRRRKAEAEEAARKAEVEENAKQEALEQALEQARLECEAKAEAAANKENQTMTAEELKQRAKELGSEAGKLAGAAADLGMAKGKQLAAKGMGFIKGKKR